VKKILANLNKAFENKVRLGIMSALMVNEHMDFTALKELLDLTDGNLASHLKNLEKKEFISIQKEFLNRKPNTKYSITPSGKNAFVKHIKAIEQLLN
jgi:DNA-binding MarR family transcriptional regulator